MNNNFEKILLSFEDFETKLEDSSKILFSGVFGSGKTTFLNDFFSDNEDYESIHIHPVNYSVASNKDIFELIKYDILFQLIGKIPKEDFEKLEIPYHLTLWAYLVSSTDLSKKTDFLASFLNFAGQSGKAFLEVYEKLKSLKKGFDKFHEGFQEDNLAEIQKYLKPPTDEKGHIYEEDFFTELIRDLLSQIQEKNKKKQKKEKEKKTVLVIDDLDRLDPEHIFRILNIFSAHIDFAGTEEKDNKFGFHKVILVCDYNNIEHIFIHKYGANADFKGYINKFYTNIYWHDPSSLIIEIIDKYLFGIKTGNDDEVFGNTRDFGVIKAHLGFILTQLLYFNVITFRDLGKYDRRVSMDKHYKLKAEKFRMANSILADYYLSADIVIYFLHSFFNQNISELLKAISQAKEIESGIIEKYYDPYDGSHLGRISELLLLIKHYAYNRDKTHKIQHNEEEPIPYNDYIFKCNWYIDEYNKIASLNCQEVSKNGLTISPVKLNYFPFLEDAIKVYLDYIK